MPYSRTHRPDAVTQQLFGLVSLAFAYFAIYLSTLILGFAIGLPAYAFLTLHGIAIPLCGILFVWLQPKYLTLRTPARTTLTAWITILALPVLIIARDYHSSHPC